MDSEQFIEALQKLVKLLGGDPDYVAAGCEGTCYIDITYDCDELQKAVEECLNK